MIMKGPENLIMKVSFRILPAIALAAALVVFPRPSLAQNCGLGNDNGKGQGNGCKGAPAPLIGAGLSGLAMGFGYGAYWLVRRRRDVG
jgi:hypothetical protein